MINYWSYGLSEGSPFSSTTKKVWLFCWRSITTFNLFINFFIPVVSTETFYERLISLVIWISWFHIRTCCTLLICQNVMLSLNPCEFISRFFLVNLTRDSSIYTCRLEFSTSWTRKWGIKVLRHFYVQTFFVKIHILCRVLGSDL